MPAVLLNVANRLPITVGEKITRSSGGLVAALEGVSSDRYTLRWLGWPGTAIEDPGRQHAVAELLERDFAATPVFLKGQEVEGHYEGLSNASIWPVLHDMPGTMRFELAWWDAYEAVNRRFADAVLAALEDTRGREPGLVWVHDYQLMLVPAMLKAARPELQVGFFLHTPFPAYEIWRCHPRRAELVAGVVGADLIGFHTFSYLRHFRTAAQRLLGAEPGITTLALHEHTATLGVFPIGINARRFEEELASERFIQRRAHLADVHRDMQVVLSVERLDYTKGVLHRLDAIDLFLRTWKARDRIKFVFVSVPSREGVEEYRDLRAEIEARVGHINGKYATLSNSPVRFVHGSVEFPDLCALYSLADVALVTPLIDGMNLVAKEYVACQREDPGVLVLSEFAGAAEELFSALLVNPYDAPAVAQAIRSALAMPAAERQARMAPMRERVLRYDATAWAASFLEALSQRPPVRSSVTADIGPERERLAAAVASGRPVALFLDYDGTLRELVRNPDEATVTPALRGLFEALAARPNLRTTVISGRTPEDLEKLLGPVPFDLVAEHGAALRHAGRWERLDRDLSYDWKHKLLSLFRRTADATPGSAVEDKRTSLVWHYRNADPELGEHKAQQLYDELSALTANEPLQVRIGRKIVEVTATSINKGAAILRLLAGPAEAPSLVLCAGDDVTDESMFRLELANLLAIKVGPGQTAAPYRLPNPGAMRTFLLEAISGRGQR